MYQHHNPKMHAAEMSSDYQDDGKIGNYILTPKRADADCCIIIKEKSDIDSEIIWKLTVSTLLPKRQSEVDIIDQF